MVHINHGVGSMLEVDVTRLVTTLEPAMISGSIAELGSDAARFTWRNAKEGAKRLLKRDELQAMSAVEIEALTLQYAAGDLRELQSLAPGEGLGGIDWQEAEKLAEQGTCGGNLFPHDDKLYHFTFQLTTTRHATAPNHHARNRTMATTTPQTAVDALGLKVRAEFVPFSKSRNAADSAHLMLNWKVTLVRVHGSGNEAGHDILTTDYSAGAGHCPSYRARETIHSRAAVEFECENGYAARGEVGSMLGFQRGAAIQPNALDVIYSLVMDSEVLGHGTFESWASELGYDVDSRKAESTYRACMAIALQLLNGVGESGLAALREAFSEY